MSPPQRAASRSKKDPSSHCEAPPSPREQKSHVTSSTSCIPTCQSFVSTQSFVTPKDILPSIK